MIVWSEPNTGNADATEGTGNGPEVAYSSDAHVRTYGPPWKVHWIRLDVRRIERRRRIRRDNILIQRGLYGIR